MELYTSSADLLNLRGQLRFQIPLEHAYQDDYNKKLMRIARPGTALAILVYLSFWILDLYTLPLAYREIWLIRAAEILLLNILPAPIADRHKLNEKVADYYESASILFADIVNFTPLSSTLTPAQIVELLNQVFSYFDSLVEKYGVEKIKTIGDCYMAAAGVPTPRRDHACVLTMMALEIQDYVANHSFLDGIKLSFRLGINSGPLVAGIIGSRKFIYDLWGDSVNTASRMESHGEEGVIQITRATYELVEELFNCEPRGRVLVKGKGEMEVF